jgi:hypothetical protein
VSRRSTTRSSTQGSYSVGSCPRACWYCHVKGASCIEKIVSKQLSQMMECACRGQRHHKKTVQEKRGAVVVMLTFSAPSPDKTAGASSMRDRARVIGVPTSTLHCLKKMSQRSVVSSPPVRGEFIGRWPSARRGT